mmetsp:Transcript_26956/g.4960  ORF Transcript_26956/g.4960 Transcript_26956/m.4960 type:complete len:111 (+) Transcript_26956:2760-3092(+)
MILSIILFPDDSFVNIVAISFTALILTELANIILEIEKYHWAMVVSQILSVISYLVSMVILQSYFDLDYIMTGWFLAKVLVIFLASFGPICIGTVLKRRIDPEEHQKLNR